MFLVVFWLLDGRWAILRRLVALSSGVLAAVGQYDASVIFIPFLILLLQVTYRLHLGDFSSIFMGFGLLSAFFCANGGGSYGVTG